MPKRLGCTVDQSRNGTKVISNHMAGGWLCLWGANCLIWLLCCQLSRYQPWLVKGAERGSSAAEHGLFWFRVLGLSYGVLSLPLGMKKY